MIAFLSITIFLFFIPDLLNNHYYETQLTARFISSYVLISLFAYIIEGLRKTFYIRLQEKKAELERSLNEIQTLSGLWPICSSCKKIRDDKGYWGQLESYITKHSEAQFSHSICPECHAKIKIELTSSKKTKPMLNKQFFTDMFGSNSTLDEEEIRKRIFLLLGYLSVLCYFLPGELSTIIIVIFLWPSSIFLSRRFFYQVSFFKKKSDKSQPFLGSIYFFCQ